MNKYNLLTKKLLEQGYTADNHPDYVMIGGTMMNKSLDNFDGGFIYYGWYIYERIFKTPCGMLLKGKFANSGLSWLWKEYNYENDCPWIICPKGECDCQLRDEPFKSQGTGVLCRHCIVHETDEEWHYEGSCEAERHLLDDQILSMILQSNNRICENHMRYDIHTKKMDI